MQKLVTALFFVALKLVSITEERTQIIKVLFTVTLFGNESK